MVTSSKSKFKADPTVAAQKKKDAMQLLERGVEELLISDKWLAYLKFQKGFHTYSFQNTLLIYMQYPEATQVAGFQSWLKKGRCVRKGEKGITILAPMPYSRLDRDSDGNEIEANGIAFKTATVFDVRQTDGDPIPEIIQPLLGNDSGLLNSLMCVADGLDIPVSFEDLDSANGYCYFTGGKPTHIAVKNSLTLLHKAKTLAHELAHAVLHGEMDYGKHRSECELEAESVAFCLLNYFSLDTSDYSFGYLAAWQGDKAIVQLRKSATAIQKAVNQIIGAIEG